MSFDDLRDELANEREELKSEGERNWRLKHESRRHEPKIRGDDDWTKTVRGGEGNSFDSAYDRRGK